MKIPREQFFFALFFALWIAAATGSHWLGSEIIRIRRHYDANPPAQVEAPVAVGQTPPLDPQRERAAGMGIALLILNVPLFIGLAPMLNGGMDQPGLTYWVLAVLGCVYVPFLATLSVYFWVHAPNQPRNDDWGDDPDDEDQETKPRA